MLQPIDKPPKSDNDQDTNQNDRVVVHQISCDWERIGKAEHDVEEDNQNTAKGVNHKAVFAHPEIALGGVLSATYEVREDG